MNELLYIYQLHSTRAIKNDGIKEKASYLARHHRVS